MVAKDPFSRAEEARPPLLSPSEVLTLAILSQWSRFRSERDFFRFADAHLRKYSPNRKWSTTWWIPPSFRLWYVFGRVAMVCLPDKPPLVDASPRPSGSTAS